MNDFYSNRTHENYYSLKRQKCIFPKCNLLIILESSILKLAIEFESAFISLLLNTVVLQLVKERFDKNFFT